jgi:hypothetical protein
MPALKFLSATLTGGRKDGRLHTIIEHFFKKKLCHSKALGRLTASSPNIGFSKM